MSDLTKAVEQVRRARWDAWCRMAETLPNHHVLAVELFRTEEDDTLAIFTLVRNHKVVQEVLRGNARGLGVRAVVPHHHHCDPIEVWPQFQVEAMRLAAAPADPPPDDGGGGDGGATVDGIALGEPPPKQPPEPGIISTGTAILPTVFDLGERATR